MNGILIKSYLIPKIVAREKTVTRRVIQIHPDNFSICKDHPHCFIWDFNNSHYIFKPRYHVDEVVYVKETYTYVTLAEKDPWKDRAIADGSFRRKPDGSPVAMRYKLDGYEPAKWETPLFMPAWAARYFIQITDVRPERLQDIWIKDAIAEGFSLDLNMQHFGTYKDPITKFTEAWDSINPDYPFDSNSWVFRYAFKYLPDYKYELSSHTRLI